QLVLGRVLRRQGGGLRALENTISCAMIQRWRHPETLLSQNMHPRAIIHVDIAELIGRDRAEVQPPRLVTGTVCAHQVVIDARLAILACPTSPPPQARIFLG